MNTALSLNFDQSGMYLYSPDQNPASALSHQLFPSLRCESHEISGLAQKSIKVIHGDIRDEALLEKVFEEHSCEAVIHFAGLKAVGESVAEPLKYYDVNVSGSVALLRAMGKANIKKFIFSSSAAVYGACEELPIKESAPCHPANPYGRSKLIVEKILSDLVQSDSSWNVMCLRYFNPIGAHPSGLIGETPQGVPSNLMPYLTQAVASLRQELAVFGNDYPTSDGSAVRDYIHVMDLAEGHIAAVRHAMEKPGMTTLNLGTGKGYSVLEMITAFEKATGKKVPYKFSPRRSGDVAACWADASAAERLLGWKAKRSLEEMCRDSWNWQQQGGKNL
ncbi:MAG: UDP-glucose 4-epimerase GalE [Verrucomicrobia bacterium]|nr:UDP-glucose 4-epimerase GalE [Verrucomicrobiota bacterium]